MQIDELLKYCRNSVEEFDATGDERSSFRASLTYRIILQETKPPFTKGPIQRIARGEAAVYFARLALKNDKVGEAGDWYREALEADPRCGEYRSEYALKCLLPMGLDDAALVEATRAVQIEPENIHCWRPLAQIEHAAGTLAGSMAARRKALELAPDDSVIILDMAVGHIDAMEYNEAQYFIDKVLIEHPERSGDALHLAAAIAYRQGRHLNAIDIFEKALEHGVEDLAMAKWNRALAYQSIGMYKEGWADYEERGNQKAVPDFAVPMKRFIAPIWKGEPPPACIHLHEEMGHGDVIVMARYAPLLAERGYDVRLEVRESFVELFAQSMPNVQVMARALDYPRALGIPPFDYHLPLLSCPHALGTEVDTIPWNGPYLKADPEDIVKQQKLLPKGERLIGLCWSSGIRKGIWLGEYGKRKSMPFKALAPLFSHDFAYISLQCGAPALENKTLPGLSVEEPSWAETAALIACLDLVITVDSAIAHLAGAMGKPVWVMMHTEGSFHHMADVEGASWQYQNPWYPSMRLYRQKHANEWQEVVEQISQELKAWGRRHAA